MRQIDVFISYKREEMSLALKLRNTLNKAGFIVGIDEDVEPNMNFVAALEEMITQAKATVVLWTKASAASEWVQIEARHALKLDRSLDTPNVYRGVLLEPVDLPMDFASVNMLDFSSDGLTDNTLSSLTDHLKDLLTPSAINEEEARFATAAFSEELLAFHTADLIDNISALKGFQERFPDSVLAPLAATRAEEHEKIWPRLVRKTLSYGGLGVICAAAGVAATLFVGRPAETPPLITLSELVTLRGDYQSALEEVEGSRNAEDILESQLVSSQALAAQSGVEVDQLKEQMNSLQTQIDANENALAIASAAESEAIQKLAETEESLTAASTENENLRLTLTEINARAETSSKDLNERITLLENGLELTQAARDRALARVEELEAQLETLTSERSTLVLETDQALAEVERLRSEPGLRLDVFSDDNQELLSELNVRELLHLAVMYSSGGSSCFSSSILTSINQSLFDAGAIRQRNERCENGTASYAISSTGLALVEAFQSELRKNLDR